jgi:hypothetical protein
MGFRTRAGVLTEADLGRWIHLTTVLDARIGHVAHYINGQSLGEITMVPFGRDARGGTVFPDALSIGLAQIGNWSSTGVSTVADERWMTRNFNGRLDELIVFDQALSPDEVQQLYKAGRP